MGRPAMSKKKQPPLGVGLGISLVHNPKLTIGYRNLEDLYGVYGYESAVHLNTHYIIYWNSKDDKTIYGVEPRKK